MNFGFTEEQELLREQVRRFLDDQCPLPVVREIMKTNEGFKKAHWQEMADLGWLGLIVPEEFGGVELGWVDLLVLFEETGRSLFPSPLASNTLAQMALIEGGSDRQKRQYLPGTVDGSKRITLAIMEDTSLEKNSVQLQGEKTSSGVVLSGKKLFVSDASAADAFIVAFKSGNKVSLAVVDKTQAGVSVIAGAPMDKTKPEGELILEKVEVSTDNIFPEAEQWPLISRLFDCGAVAVCAEAVGSAEAILEMTNQYAKDRIQFDAPIGRYQGVKHPLADMYVDIESYKSLTYYAAWCISEDKDQLAKQVSIAKGYCSDAFARIGIDSIQLHGAIGFTAEYDAQLFLKRSKWARPMFGDSDYHYQRVTDLGG